jgi:hypothetical protein
VERIDSCHSIWLFDTDRMRYRRLPRGASVDSPALATDWEPYTGLDVDVDTGSFSVVLNAERTRILRSWRHADPCPHCSTAETTGEIPVTRADAASA